MTFAGVPPFINSRPKPLLTGILSIKNAISGGYFAIESCLSVLPIVDRLIISDGGSIDGTLEALEKLRSLYPNKIEILNIPEDPGLKIWGTEDDSLNKMISLCNSEWIIELQGDEIYHEKYVVQIPDLLRSIPSQFNSIRHARWDLLWGSVRAEYSVGTMRVVRNIPNLISSWGGDHFYIGENKVPRKGFSTHNVPEEWNANDPVIYHYPFAFNQEERKERVDRDLANKNIQFIKHYLNFKKSVLDNTSRSSATIGPMVPALLRGLVGMKEYKVRNELFDKVWLTKTTGINYDC